MQWRGDGKLGQLYGWQHHSGPLTVQGLGVTIELHNEVQLIISQEANAQGPLSTKYALQYQHYSRSDHGPFPLEALEAEQATLCPAMDPLAYMLMASALEARLAPLIALLQKECVAYARGKGSINRAGRRLHRRYGGNKLRRRRGWFKR